VYDMIHAQRIVIGMEDKHAEAILRELYAPFDLRIVTVRRKSAKMTKYAANEFLALKISYMNDLANLCELVGANIEDVALGMSYDEHIGSRFLKAGIGYGGSCFERIQEMRRLRTNVEIEEQGNKVHKNTHYSMKRPLDVIEGQTEPEEV